MASAKPKRSHTPLPPKHRRAALRALHTYVAEMAGTEHDLIPELEAASVEHVVSSPARGERPSRTRSTT